MVDVVRNVLVQLGDPLEMIAGVNQSATDGSHGSDITITSPGTGTVGQTCVVSRNILRGSWCAAYTIDLLDGRANPEDMFVGVIQVPRRARLAQRRPVNHARPQDWSPFDPALQASGIANSQSVRKLGVEVAAFPSASSVGTMVRIAYNANTRELHFIIGAETRTIPDLTGPFRLVARMRSTGMVIRLHHDIETLPRMPGYRPAGVWGRLAALGMMDTTTGTVWDGRIAADGDPTFEHAASFTPGGRRRVRSVGDIVAINTPEFPGDAHRALDDWLRWDVRDEPFTILQGSHGQPLAQFSVAARGVVDAIGEPNEGRLAISCRDPAALLDVPWQADTYPDDTPLASARGRSRPTVTGACRAVPLVMTDAANLLYDVSDDAWVTAPAQVYDRGVLLTSGSGYSTGVDRKTIKRLTNPAGLQCADVAAGSLDTSVIIGATVGDFVQWSSTLTSSPRGWVNESTGTGTSVSEAAGGGARFVRGSAGFADLRINSVWPSAAGLYRIDLDIAAHAAGTLLVQQLTAAGGASVLHQVTLGSGTGMRSVWVTKAAGYVSLRLRVQAAGDITVRSIRVAGSAHVTTIGQHIRYAACYRGALPESQLAASVDAYPGIMASQPLCLATGTADRRTVVGVLDELAASVGGAWWFAPDGKLHIGALRDPDSLTPVLELDDTNIIGEVAVQLDAAAGLSTRVAGDPTWAPHGDADIADGLRTTQAGRELAEGLTSSFADIRTGVYPVAHTYAFAAEAAPPNTLLANGSGAQALADVLTGLYSKTRRLYTLTAAMDPTQTLTPGDCVALDHAGVARNLLVFGVRGRFTSHFTELTLWG